MEGINFISLQRRTYFQEGFFLGGGSYFCNFMLFVYLIIMILEEIQKQFHKLCTIDIKYLQWFQYSYYIFFEMYFNSKWLLKVCAFYFKAHNV